MKNFTKVLIFSLLGLFLLCNNASAVTIVGDSLQGIFDAYTWGENIDVQKDQLSMPKAWGLTNASLGTHMVLYNDNPDDIEFGIYSIANNIEEATVFGPEDEPIARATVSFDKNNDAVVIKYYNADGYIVDKNGNLAPEGYNYNFTGTTFGFYISDGTKKYYSDKNRNDLNNNEKYGEDDDIALLVYKADDASYVFAGDIDGDRDFANIVAQAESIKPVPEPASLALLGLGLLGLAGIGRRKFAKK